MTGEDDLITAGGPGSAETEERPMPIRTRWVRARMRLPDIERLLSEPFGTRIGDSFDSLRVRAAKAVDRIAEAAGSAGEEIRRRAGVLAIGSVTSAAIGVTAIFVALSVKSYSVNVPAGIIGIAELIAVLVLRVLQRRLTGDLFAVNDLEVRFKKPLEDARNPEDLRKLGERIRKELGEALGEEREVEGGTAGRGHG